MTRMRTRIAGLVVIAVCSVSAIESAKAIDIVCGCGGPDCQGCALCDQTCPCCVDGAILNSNRRAQCYNWNRNYAHVQYGQPVALVVPPTANLQTNWGWGVSSMRVSRLDHQFGRNYPGGGYFGGPFQNTPRWPQDTNQFGVYYVRGPW